MGLVLQACASMGRCPVRGVVLDACCARAQGGLNGAMNVCVRGCCAGVQGGHMTIL